MNDSKSSNNTTATLAVQPSPSLTPSGSPTDRIFKQDASSASVFLQTTDSSEMFQFVSRKAWTGAAIGCGLASAAQLLAWRFVPGFRRYTNVSARAFLFFSGAGVGFTLASEWAIASFHQMERNQKLPYLQGVASQDLAEVRRETRQYEWNQLKQFGWENRYKLIGTAWATTMAAVVYRDYSNPLLNSVHKFGHARLWAQGVTIAAVFLAFYFNEDTGPNSRKYTSADDREAEYNKR